MNKRKKRWRGSNTGVEAWQRLDVERTVCQLVTRGAGRVGNPAHPVLLKALVVEPLINHRRFLFKGKDNGVKRNIM